MRCDKDYFEIYLTKFPNTPSLVLVRSAELKNFPIGYMKEPILDLCCGDGFFAKCLGLSGIYGCDLNANAITKARKLKDTYKEIKKCDARDLKFFNNSEFNTVFSNCALEHVDGIGMALTNVSRVLKTGGHLIMSVPGENLNDWHFFNNYFSGIGLHTLGQHLIDKYNKRQSHVNIYPLHVWEENLKQVGLKAVHSFYIFNKKEYEFSSFLDSLNGGFLGRINSVVNKIVPVSIKKFLWRKLTKQIYMNSKPLDIGGELFIVAKKYEK